jgi:hypothetical protein
MNDDFTKDDELEVDFDPKKIKDVLLDEEDPLLVDELAADLDVEDEEEYTFDGDGDDDDDF